MHKAEEIIYMYGKLTNGRLQYAPKQVHYNGNYIINPKKDVLIALGYLPVTYTDMPADAPPGQHYESHWEEKDGAIVQVWELAEDHVHPEPEPDHAGFN